MVISKTVPRILPAVFIGIVVPALLYGQTLPLAWWSFDGSGSALYQDNSGNGHTIIATGNGLTAAAGVKNGGLQCQGSGYQMSATSTSAVLNRNRFSIECWYKPATGSFNTAQLFSFQNIQSGVRNGYAVYINSAGRVDFGMSLAGGISYVDVQSSTVLQANRWYHIVATYDSVNLRIYINGTLEGTAANTSGGYPAPGTDARIGCQRESTGNVWQFLNGTLDEVKFYGITVSADSVAAHFNALKPEPTLRLMAHWSFDSVSATGKTFYDVTGNGFNAAGRPSDSIGLSTGVLGNALNCYGKGFDIMVKNSAANFGLNTYTIEAWVYSAVDLNSPSSFWNYRSLFDNTRTGNSGSNIRGGFAMDITDRALPYTGLSKPDGSGWVDAISDTAMAPRQWYHLAATYDGTALKFFVNGKKRAQIAWSSTSILPNPLNTRIACQLMVNSVTDTVGTLRNWFIGKIDEMKLYNYALDSHTIASDYDALKPEVEKPFQINFGMNTTYALPGDTVWVPVYLANYEQYTINACQLCIKIDTAKLRLIDISKDSGLVKNAMLAWNQNPPDSIRIAIAGLSQPISYGDGEFIRCRYVIKPSVRPGDTCYIQLKDIQIDEANKVVTAAQVPGKIITRRPSVIYGDVTGDGKVTVFDAQDILSYAIGAFTLPDVSHPNFTVVAADVSGVRGVTSYDAALVMQYSVGLLSEFPVQRQRLAKETFFVDRSPVPVATFTISLASQNTIDGMKFNITGTNLRGFIAGEFTLNYSTLVSNISKGIVTTTVRGAKLNSASDPARQLIHIVMSTSDDIDITDPVVLAAITLPPNSTTDPSRAFTLTGVMINEGLIPTDITTSALPRDPAGTMYPGAVSLVKRRLNIVTGGTEAKLTVFALNGRMVESRTFGKTGTGQVVMDMSGFRKGAYVYRLIVGTMPVKCGKIMITN